MMEIRSPIYTTNGNITCEINHPKHGWIPTTASPDDPHTADVFAAAEALGPAAYVPPPPPTSEEVASSVRIERDKLLTQSDWTQVADAPVDQAAWATYRQALRDIPQQAGFPYSVTWPTKPE